MIFYSLFVLALMLGSLALLIWNVRRVISAIVQTVAFNTGGSSPMARLVPNLAFLALFLLLFNVTWI